MTTFKNGISHKVLIKRYNKVRDQRDCFRKENEKLKIEKERIFKNYRLIPKYQKATSWVEG